MIRSLTYAITASLSSTAALTITSASHASGTFDDMFFSDEIPVVLTASRLRQPISEAPTAMTTIDRKEIERSGIRSIPELFRMVPGMVIGYYKGSWPVVAYHGVSDQYSRRMQILIDGRAVYLPDQGGPDWSSLPLIIDDIARIEITRGTNAPTYGSNSFMGVINIITRHSSDTVGKMVRHDSGTGMIESTVMRYGETRGDFGFRISLSDKQQNLFQRPGYEHDNYQESQNINIRADLQLTPDDHMMFEAGYVDDLKNDRKTKRLYATNTVRQYTQIELINTQSIDNEFKLQLYYSKHEHDATFRQRFASGSSTIIDVRDPVTNERYDIEGQYTFTAGQQLRGAVGASVRKDQLWSPYGFNNDNTYVIDINRLFSNIEYRISDNWLAHFGIMVEDHDYMGQRSSPRIATNIHLSDTSHLRISAAKAYRAPLAFEKYANRGVEYLGNNNYEFLIQPGTNLVPEEITSYDIGYIITPPGSGFTHDMRVFHEELKQLITPYLWGPVAGDVDFIAIGFANNSQATLDGIELSSKYEANDWSGQFTYSYIDIDHKHDEGLFTYYNYDKSAPLHKASLMLEKRFDSGLFASASYHHTDKVKWLPVQEEEAVEMHDRLDLSIGGTIMINNNPASVRFVMENVLTGDYSDFQKDNVYQRQAYISIKVEHM